MEYSSVSSSARETTNAFSPSNPCSFLEEALKPILKCLGFETQTQAKIAANTEETYSSTTEILNVTITSRGTPLRSDISTGPGGAEIN